MVSEEDADDLRTENFKWMQVGPCRLTNHRQAVAPVVHSRDVASIFDNSACKFCQL